MPLEPVHDQIPKRPHRSRLGAFLQSRLTGVLLIATLLMLWEISAAREWIVSDNWPRFSAVLLAGYRGLVSGELATPLSSTLYRMFAGYAAGCALGVSLGVLLGSYRLLDWAIRPLIEIQRILPSPAIVPPLILFLGVDDALKIVLVLMAALAPVFVNTYGGVRSVDETLLMTARTLGLGRVETVRKIVVPATLPSLTAGMRIALSLALIMAVISEMISGSGGIGSYLITMQYAMRADAMYAALICIAALGYASNRVFVHVERAALFWMHGGGAFSKTDHS